MLAIALHAHVVVQLQDAVLWTFFFCVCVCGGEVHSDVLIKGKGKEVTVRKSYEAWKRCWYK